MKKYTILAVSSTFFYYIFMNATPYAGSITGAGQEQKSLLRGYAYSPDPWPHSKRRFQGRVLKMGPSREFYYKRFRYIQEIYKEDPGTVHSRP